MTLAIHHYNHHCKTRHHWLRKGLFPHRVLNRSAGQMGVSSRSSSFTPEGWPQWPCSVWGLTGQPGLGAWTRGLSGCQDDARFNYHNVNKVSTNSFQKEPKNGFKNFKMPLKVTLFTIMLSFFKRKNSHENIFTKHAWIALKLKFSDGIGEDFCELLCLRNFRSLQKYLSGPL